jgi:ABC-type sulfate transport system substrate-binding protein
MAEKVIIEEAPVIMEEEGEEEGEVTFSNSHDYISSAVEALSILDGFDTALVSKADERRVNRIKRQSLRILSHYINELYDETFDNPDDDNND